MRNILAFVFFLPLALSLARCHLTAAQAAIIEDAAADTCARLLPLTDLPAGVDALACEGAEEALRLALAEAAKASPAAAPTPARAPVYRRGRLVGVVPAHLVKPVSDALK